MVSLVSGKSQCFFLNIISVVLRILFPGFYYWKMHVSGDLLDAGAELLKARSTWALPMHDDDVHAFGLFGFEQKNGKFYRKGGKKKREKKRGREKTEHATKTRKIVC